MKYLGTFLMLLYASFVGFAQTLIEVKSPDNRLKLDVSLSQKGEVTYGVHLKNTTIISLLRWVLN